LNNRAIASSVRAPRVDTDAKTKTTTSMKPIFAHSAHRNLRSFKRSDDVCCAPAAGMPANGRTHCARTI
jgi:hypothetical protein